MIRMGKSICHKRVNLSSCSIIVREIFGGEGSKIVKRLHDSDSDEDEPSAKKIVPSHKKPTDILSEVRVLYEQLHKKTKFLHM